MISNFLMRAFFFPRKLEAKETSDWFSALSEEEQSKYLEEHPNSKFAKDAKKKAEAPAEKPAGNPIVKKPTVTAPPADQDTGEEGDDADEEGGEAPALPSAALKPAHKNPAKWPAHIQALKLPPAWTDVRYNEDPNANLQAIGRDAKGRAQYVYSEAFSKSQAAAKFTRILELNKQYTQMETQNDTAVNSRDPNTKAHGECMKLIMKMGLRPGSTEDTGAEKQAYGATTLQADHVVSEKGKIFLRFTGKKGVDLNLEVTDPEVAKFLVRRKKAATEPTGRLFPQVSPESLSAHSQSLGTGGFKTKDFRTSLATRTAYDMVSQQEAPTSQTGYKKAVKDVAVSVSQRLGNTPTVALQSYIAPQVFAQWQTNLGM